MKYYIIAGEASGDLHGANLIKKLKENDPQAEFRVWGGDLMEKQGATLVKHYKNHSFMGFMPVIMNIRTIRKNFKFCYSDLTQYKPDVLILIDYSGFNLRVAKWVKKKLGLKIFYFIAPQVWAWRQWRVKIIIKLIDKVFVILPFEEEFYAKHNYKVYFVGHPLLDAIDNWKEENKDKFDFRKENGLTDKPIIALLPGSRKHEIEHMLPLMLKTINYYPDYQFILGGAPTFAPMFYDKYIKDYDVKVIFGQTYHILNNAHAAFVTSGTASLETGLFNVPQVVCFKVGYITGEIVRLLLKIKYASIINLVLNRSVFAELIQENFTFEKLKIETDKIILDNAYRKQVMEGYKEAESCLGGLGACERAAKMMVGFLKNEKNEN